MANTIFGRLNFSYDTSKFGSGFYVSQNASNTLNTFPSDVQNWQKQEIANGTISISNYFKNPVATISNGISANTTLIKNFCLNNTLVTFPSNFAEAQNLANTANNLLIQILDFKSHTDNMTF